MSEHLITLNHIDPAELYGPANVNINLISAKFPRLKIVARGGAIKLLGDRRDIDTFVERFDTLIAYKSRYGHISTQVIDQLFDSSPLSAAANGVSTEASSAGATIAGDDPTNDVIVYGNNGNIIRARTHNQKQMVARYADNDLLFAIGPAGSGKTYTAIALAVRALKNKEVKKIILTRPAVEAGEKLGFLPGDMKEKLDPYLQPLYDALNDMIPQKKLGEYMDQGIVQIAPLAYMRGRTLDNAFVILDEAQNTVTSQIRMFLTRMGRNAKFIVTGDITQIDLPRQSDSGLVPTLNALRGIKGIAVIEFDKRDILRHELVKRIVQAFENEASVVRDSDSSKSIDPHR